MTYDEFLPMALASAERDVKRLVRSRDSGRWLTLLDSATGDGVTFFFEAGQLAGFDLSHGVADGA